MTSKELEVRIAKIEDNCILGNWGIQFIKSPKSLLGKEVDVDKQYVLFSFSFTKQ